VVYQSFSSTKNTIEECYRMFSKKNLQSRLYCIVCIFLFSSVMLIKAISATNMAFVNYSKVAHNYEHKPNTGANKIYSQVLQSGVCIQ